VERARRRTPARPTAPSARRECAAARSTRLRRRGFGLRRHPQQQPGDPELVPPKSVCGWRQVELTHLAPVVQHDSAPHPQASASAAVRNAASASARAHLPRSADRPVRPIAHRSPPIRFSLKSAAPRPRPARPTPRNACENPSPQHSMTLLQTPQCPAAIARTAPQRASGRRVPSAALWQWRSQSSCAFLGARCRRAKKTQSVFMRTAHDPPKCDRFWRQEHAPS